MQLISSLPSALKSNDDVNFKDCFSLLFHPVRWITISLSGTYWLQHLQVSLSPYFSIVHFCKDQLSLCLISVFDGDDFNFFFAKNLKPMSGFLLTKLSPCFRFLFGHVKNGQSVQKTSFHAKTGLASPWSAAVTATSTVPNPRTNWIVVSLLNKRKKKTKQTPLSLKQQQNKSFISFLRVSFA